MRPIKNEIQAKNARNRKIRWANVGLGIFSKIRRGQIKMLIINEGSLRRTPIAHINNKPIMMKNDRVIKLHPIDLNLTIWKIFPLFLMVLFGLIF